ncbi:MAG: alkaline phosphatase family protein [Candidatus Micrarchaeaceae archaeon]
MKTYLIGLDSVPVWLFEEMATDKRLDAIRWFARRSNLKDLKSNMPPVTASAWLTIYTGLSEGDLGIYDFLRLNGRYELELADFNYAGASPFWDLPSKKSLIITPAMITKLTDSRNVDMVTGFPARYKTNNSTIARFMKEFGLEEEPDIERKVEKGEMSARKASRILAGKIKLKLKLMGDMDGRKKYDLIFLCITETDRIQHFTLSRKEWKKYMLPLFVEINDVFDYLRSKCAEEKIQIIIVSDHGGVATYKKFIINGWLVKNGYAKLKRNTTKLNVDSPVLRSIYRGMPNVIKSRVTNMQMLSQGFTVKDLDLVNTVAFSATSTNKIVPVWMNDSRFVFGNDRNAAHKGRLAKDLAKLSFIKGVFDGKKYYGKTDKFIVPDLLVEAKDGYTIKTNEMGTNILENVDIFRGGEHTRYGIIGAYPKILSSSKAYSVRDVSKIVLKSLSN